MSHETFKAPDLDQLAEMLPAYDFEAFIAQGGMGAVYKARQRSLDREVAIKILPRELGEDPEFRESFETEAKAMARLNHPNLLGVYDYGDIDGMPYIVMEFVNGKSLYHSAWNTIVDPDQAISIVIGICQGLGHAHEHGILHRDIKPANILLTPKAQPKIGDFGLAQQADAAGTGMAMGTPGYAAPELTQAPETAGMGADIYAVGVILHELITGQRPDPTGQEAPRPFGDRNLDAIWMKATAPDIASRYPTAEAMATDLAAWKPLTRRLATGIDPAAAKPKSLLVTAPGTSAAVPPRAGTRPVKSSGGGMARNLIILVFVLAAVGIGFKMLGQPKEDRPEKTETVEADTTPDLTDTVATTSPVSTEPKDAEATPDVPDESTLEGLARLKDDLALGKRSEFPPGTKRRGTSDYLLIESPMAWYDALVFAENHGGHLAILKSDEELSWLSSIIGSDEAVWLGSGRADGMVWTDTDGANWSLDSTPSGVGPFATLSHLGILRAGKVAEKRPFVIQWRRDGENPATLAQVLGRTAETIDTPNPSFPPGTVSLGARHALFLPLPVPRNQAADLAEKAGGILAVPAGRQEIGWLRDESSELDGSLGFWLGGRRIDGTWKWDSGEAWEHDDWIDGTAPTEGGDALILSPGKGWANADAQTTTAGMVIEWSRDAPSE